MTASAASIDVRDLGARSELGSGGEGRVFACANLSGQVFKEYQDRNDPTRHEIPLARLIERKDQLEQAFREQGFSSLADVISWPSCIVRDHDKFVGFVMPEIPRRFMMTVQVGSSQTSETRPTEWNYLCHPEYMRNRNVRLSVDYPDDIKVRARLCELFARALTALHRAEVIAGDISGKNLLWSTRPDPAIFLIDADGSRILFEQGVSHHKQTPDYMDPELGGGPTSVRSDSYKLMLVVFRALVGHGTMVPSSETIPSIGESPLKHLGGLFERGLRGDRPRPDEWIGPLEALATDDRVRGTITVAAAGPSKPSRRPGARTPGRVRGTITLRPESFGDEQS